jgi:hypothetical protein
LKVNFCNRSPEHNSGLTARRARAGSTAAAAMCVAHVGHRAKVRQQGGIDFQ